LRLVPAMAGNRPKVCAGFSDCWRFPTACTCCQRRGPPASYCSCWWQHNGEGLLADDYAAQQTIINRKLKLMIAYTRSERCH
jgi:hypothetical protein